MFKFQKLEVWKKAILYADILIVLAEKLPNSLRHTIGSQLIRAALSIPNNIAEGSGRQSPKEQRQFFNIGKGSAYETVTILVILVKRSHLSKDEFNVLYEQADEICRMLSGLMKGNIR